MINPPVRNRNPEFDFWKFIAAVSVLLVHTHVFYGGTRIVWANGHFAVELFFLLTGFLFAESVFKDDRPFSCETIGTETWQFLWKKIRLFLPFYLFGYLATLVVAAIRFPTGRFVRQILPMVPLDILLLGETGVPVPYVQVVNWYLSAMLVSLFLLYPAFRFRKRLFADWMAPAFSLFLLGIVFTKFGTIAPHYYERVTLLPACLFRALSEILLGVFASRIASRLRDRMEQIPARTRTIASFAGTLAPIAAFALIGISKSERIAPAALCFFFVFVCLSGAGLSIARTRLPVSACRWLARFGLAMFLTHTAIRHFLIYLSRHGGWLASVYAKRDAVSIAIAVSSYLVLSAAFGLLCMAVCSRLTACWQTPMSGSSSPKRAN